MGGALGNPITEHDQQRINDTLHDVLTIFATEFSKAYTQAAIVNAKAELDPPHSREDDMKLHVAPPTDGIAKAGMLVKRGESVKSWKARYFVAYNAKDNYKIDYHDGTSETAKIKGTIHCAGYRAYEFNSDDIREHGEAGIKLVPWSYRRRTWYIKCENNEERKEWLSVFETACNNAEPPRDEDACIATAFDKTLQALRWRYWFWGWYGQAGNEAERLGEFILDLLDRDIVNAILDGVPSSPAKYQTCELVRRTIGGTVKSATSAAWTSSVTAVRSMSATVQNQVKELITPLVEQEIKIKKTVIEKVTGTTNPFMSDKGSTLLTPILNVIFRPIINALVLACEGFHSHMTSKISSNEFAPARFEETLRRCYWEFTWWSGPMGKAFDCLYQMYVGDLAQFTSLLVGGVSPYTLYYIVREKLSGLIRRAVYTFGSLAKSIGESEVAGVLSHVMQLLFHDVIITAEVIVNMCMTRILNPLVTELVYTPCKELVKPVQDMITALPIPGLSLLFDLNEMLDAVLVEIVDQGILALISGNLAGVKDTVHQKARELGVTPLAA